jgi:hypothetical protein
MLRRLTLLAIPVAAWLVAACATGSHPLVKYPPRRPGCSLSIYHTDLPQVQDWDDLGKVEVICHIDDTDKTCFNRLHAEACRMGGDIIYRLPVKPWRPKEEALGYRAMIAHRRVAAERDAGSPDVELNLPPPATPEESAGPVVPLTGPGAPTAAPQGGPGLDAGIGTGAVARDAGSTSG